MIKLASGQEKLWQWDTGQRLVLDYPSGTLIDLSTNGRDVAGRIAYEESGTVYVDIPDSMLTCAGKKLYVYVNHTEDRTCTTVLEASFAIRSRSKPADYSPPGDEEVLYWRKLAQDTEAAAERAAASADAAAGEAAQAGSEADRAGQNILNGVDSHNQSAAAHPHLLSEVARVESIARGRNFGVVFDTKDAMDSWLMLPENVATLEVGTNLYIRAMDVPDYWWDGTTAQPLEVEHPDLSQYVTKTQLSMELPAVVTQAEYDRLSAAGQLVAGRIYYVMPGGA